MPHLWMSGAGDPYEIVFGSGDVPVLDICSVASDAMKIVGGGDVLRTRGCNRAPAASWELGMAPGSSDPPCWQVNLPRPGRGSLLEATLTDSEQVLGCTHPDTMSSRGTSPWSTRTPAG